MKKVILTLTALILAVCMNATEHTETFSGLNSTTAKDGKHMFDLGEWTFSGMAYGSSALKFNTNGAYVISPKLDNITKLSFTYRSGGSNKKITVSYSVDGTNWTEIDNFTIPGSSSSFSTWTKNVSLGDITGIQFRILAASSNCYIKVFTASDEDTGSGGNHDYSDDPNYKTDGVDTHKSLSRSKKDHIYQHRRQRRDRQRLGREALVQHCKGIRERRTRHTHHLQGRQISHQQIRHRRQTYRAHEKERHSRCTYRDKVLRRRTARIRL